MSDVRYPLKSARDKAVAKDMADDIAKLMYMTNVGDVLPLCAQFTRRHHSEVGEYEEQCVHPDSAYGHLHAALISVLRMLGVPDARLGEAVDDLVSHRSAAEQVVACYTAQH